MAQLRNDLFRLVPLLSHRGPPEGSTKAVVSIGSSQSHEKCGKNLAVQRRKIMKLGILIAGAALSLMLAGNGSLAQNIKHFHPKGEPPSKHTIEVINKAPASMSLRG
jgi:hypothetical protein